MSPSKRQFQRADAAIERATDAVVDVIHKHCRDAVAMQYLVERFLLALTDTEFLDMLAKQGGEASVRLLNPLLDYRDAQGKERG
jgi:hypothetical protein